MNDRPNVGESVAPEETIYHLDPVNIWWKLQPLPPLLLSGIGLLLIIIPLVRSLPTGPLYMLMGVLLLSWMGFSQTLRLYGCHMHNTVRLTISPTGVRLENPFYTLQTPWANILRIGSATVVTGDPRGDALAAKMNAGQDALLLRAPIGRWFHKADPVGQLLRPLMRPERIPQQNYLEITQFLQSSQGAALLRDLQRFAPYLEMPRTVGENHGMRTATPATVLQVTSLSLMAVSFAVLMGSLLFTTADPNANPALSVPRAAPTLPAAVPTASSGVPPPAFIAATPTPPPAALQPATMITPSLVSTMSLVTDLALGAPTSLPSSEPIHSWTFAPTGDKLVYITRSGSLYWSNLDGSQPTLITQYPELYDQLEEQQPQGNTLILQHLGPWNPQLQSRPLTHMDSIQFTLDQPPTLIEGGPTAEAPHHLHWWSPTRVSGIAHAGYLGGDDLITLDALGSLVERRNIPFMLSGAVQPGGAWLAYSTDRRHANLSVPYSAPQTVYLYNLQTGQRLQITPAGQGSYVGSWSPDGAWFLMDATAGVTLVSADGAQRIVIPHGAADAVWSSDSTKLAWATLRGISPDGHKITSWTSEAYIVNIRARTVSTVALPRSTSGPDAVAGLLWKPHWSPDGTQLGFLSFDPNCPGECSSTRPAFYLFRVNPK